MHILPATWRTCSLIYYRTYIDEDCHITRTVRMHAYGNFLIFIRHSSSLLQLPLSFAMNWGFHEICMLHSYSYVSVCLFVCVFDFFMHDDMLSVTDTIITGTFLSTEKNKSEDRKILKFLIPRTSDTNDSEIQHWEWNITLFSAKSMMFVLVEILWTLSSGTHLTTIQSNKHWNYIRKWVLIGNESALFISIHLRLYNTRAQYYINTKSYKSYKISRIFEDFFFWRIAILESLVVH